jgi:hypothetical protein
MVMRRAGVLRVCVETFRAVLQGLLLAWTAAAPLVWILRDGLGPDSAETGWIEGGLKFLVGWGGPALVLAAPLVLLALLDRRRTGKPRGGV